MFQGERGLSGALTPDPTSWVGGRGCGAEKGGGLSMGAWEAKEYEGYYCLAKQPDGQQMRFVLPNTLQPELEG